MKGEEKTDNKHSQDHRIVGKKFPSFLSFKELKTWLRCEFLAIPQVIGLSGMSAMTSITITWQIHWIISGKSCLQSFGVFFKTTKKLPSQNKKPKQPEQEKTTKAPLSLKTKQKAPLSEFNIKNKSISAIKRDVLCFSFFHNWWFTMISVVTVGKEKWTHCDLLLELVTEI